MTPSGPRDARLAAIREEAADMFATLPPGAVVVRAMQLLAMVDAREAEVERLKALLTEASGELRNHDRDSFGHPVSTVVELLADIKVAVDHG